MLRSIARVSFGLGALLLFCVTASAQWQAGDGEETVPHHGARNGDNDDDGVLPLFAPFDGGQGYAVGLIDGIPLLFVEGSAGLTHVVTNGTIVATMPTKDALALLEGATGPSAGVRSCWAVDVGPGQAYIFMPVLLIGDCGPSGTIDCAVQDYHERRTAFILAGNYPTPGMCP